MVPWVLHRDRVMLTHYACVHADCAEVALLGTASASSSQTF